MAKEEEAIEIEENEENEQSFKSSIVELLQTFIIGLLICIFIKGTMAEARYIPSGSMEPTLKVNDRILVQKVTSYFGDKFKRGDVVVFYPPKIETGVEKEQILGRFIPFFPESPPAFIKRVVGLPGDEIVVKANEGVYINGKLINEPYIAEPPEYDLQDMNSIAGINMNGEFIRPFAGDNSPIIVPDGHLFVMGDNRNASADSHVWGFADQKKVVGKLCLVFWKNSWIGQ